MKSFNRRKFLQKSTVGAVGLTLASNLSANEINSLSYNSRNTGIITRKLGNTGIEVPVLSIGCGGLDSPSVIKAALKVGVKFFDTAYRYQKGNSEKILGDTLKDYDRDSFYIATKISPQSSEEEFLNMLDESLQRLQMNYVDILYLHSVKDKETALDETMLNALKKAKSLGKTKHIGLSTHKNEPEVIQAAIDSNTYEVILTAINFKQEHNAEIKAKLALATQKGIGIVGMKVMAGGYLDNNKTKPVNHLAALKWVVADENIHTTIPSMVNLEQLTANLPLLSDISLSRKEKKDLALAEKEEGLYCNACGQCIAMCQKNLPIPELMRAYMYSYGYRSALQAKELLTDINVGSSPCADCNYCTTSCVKGFRISDKIQDICQLVNIPDQFLV